MGYWNRMAWDVTRQIENDEVIPTRVVKVLINLLKFIILLLVKKKEIREACTVACRRCQPHKRLWKSLRKTLRSEG
jgi:hypothetical protein